jgi:uncharacterized protein
MTRKAQGFIRASGLAARWACLALCLSVPTSLPAAATLFEFKAPTSVDDSNVDSVMRDLAERIIPVYEESDPGRYLENVSALQMVAGSYAAAVESRKSLAERMRADSRSTVSRATVYDLYARAKAIQAEDHTKFDAGFNKAFHEIVPKLDDSAAYSLIQWLEISPAGYRAALQNAFNRQRQNKSIDGSDATMLMWAYLSFEAYRDISPVIGPLIAEDDRRRYIFDDAVTLKVPGGASLIAIVVRPRNSAGALPALLEYSLGSSSGYAKECASRGYVGVTAYSRGAGSAARFVPFQFDGKAVGAVIDWIAAQKWSDGRVGMYGTAYSGFTAWSAAKYPRAALKAIATIAPTAPGIDFPMQGGIFHNSAFQWSLAASDPKAAVSSTFDEEISADRQLDEKWYRSGEPYRQMGRLFGTPNPLFIRWLNHPSYDRYWQKMIPFQNEFAAIKIPTLTITGYYAESEPGALYYFEAHRNANPAADDTLVVGPYDDARLTGNLSNLNGLQIDPVAAVDLRDLRYRWFNSIFKSDPLPALVQQGRVNMEIAGADQWIHAASVDAIAGAPRRLYLEAEREDSGYRLAPGHGKSIKFVTQRMDLKDRSDADWRPAGSFVSKTIEAHNGLVFVSKPLTKPLDVAGALAGELDLVTNKMDLDLTLTLYERTNEGENILLTNPGYQFRSSYVHDRVHRRLLQAGTRQRIRFVSDRPFARRLKPGSRVVLVLALNKRADQEINYGSGNDVSADSIADAGPPVRVQWFNDSFIEIPIHR